MNQLATVTHRNLATVDLLIIGLYLLIVFAIGLCFARRERSFTEHFLAGHDVGWFVASLFVSNISTGHFGLSGPNQEQVKFRTVTWGRIGAGLGNFGKRYAF
jgi:hypothetical protein